MSAGGIRAEQSGEALPLLPSQQTQGQILLIICVFHLQDPEIFSVSPNVVSFYGKNRAVLTGRNLSGVSAVRVQAHRGCRPWE